MSADNWTECPACIAAYKARCKAREVEVAESYGKVPVAQWEALKSKLIVRPEDTFREDYEIGVLEDGRFYVSYSGGCSTCKASYRFKHEVPNAVAPDDGGPR